MIVVGGEALYDLVLQGSAEDLHGHPGGGPFNTARTLGRLERPVAYLGRLSDDSFGQRLEALLTSDGVSLESVVRTEDPTTLALAEVDDDGVARYRFYERGTSAPGLSPRPRWMPCRPRWRSCTSARWGLPWSRWRPPWRRSCRGCRTAR